MKYQYLTFFLFFSTCSLHAQDFKFPKVKCYSEGIKGTTLMIDKGAATMSDWFSYMYNKIQNDKPAEIDMWTSDTIYLQPFPRKLVDALMPDTTLLPEKYRFMTRMFYRLINHPYSDKEYSLDDFIPDNVYEAPTVIVGNNGRIFSLPMSPEEKKSKLRDSILIYYLQLPVVGVSFMQVQDYLKWRCKLESQSAPIQKLSKKGYYLKSVRLLTREEWLNLSPNFGPRQAGNHSATIDTMDNDTCRCYLLNVIGGNPGKMYGAGSVPVYSYWADSLGLSNMYGNVAEMTNEEGIATGASYLDYGSACKPEHTIQYSSPEPWLGFRCVLEFAKK